MKVLLVNDDGYTAMGIWAMQRALVSAGHAVTFVAPKTQQSWAGKSMWSDRPFSVETETIHDQLVHVVDSTPAACTRFALYEVMGESKPDFVVSGINYGGNDSVVYSFNSGTLGAALEASLDGIRSIGVSLAQYKRDATAEELEAAYDRAANLTALLLGKLENWDFPDHTDLLNLNIPYSLESQEIKVKKLSRLGYSRLFEKNSEGKYEKIRGSEVHDYRYRESGEDTDSYWIGRGYPTLTPISLEMADQKAINDLENQIRS